MGESLCVGQHYPRQGDDCRLDKLYDIFVVRKELVRQLVEFQFDVLAMSAMATIRLGAMAHRAVVVDVFGVGDTPQDITPTSMYLEGRPQSNNVVENAE